MLVTTPQPPGPGVSIGAFPVVEDAFVTLAVEGDNLLDDEVRNSASFKKDEILLPGRNVRVSLTARL